MINLKVFNMMYKKSCIIALALTLISSTAQAWTPAYPTKHALKKADHVTSLIMTGTFVSAMILKTQAFKRCTSVALVAFIAATSANVVINGMALKYEKSPAAILKLLLPATIVGEICGMIGRIGKKKRLLNAMAISIILNGLKNFWDVYSLVRPQQTENMMDGHAVSVIA